MKKYITLGEVCEKGSSTLMQKDLSLGNGPYKIYGASGLLGTVDFYKQEKEYIGIVKDGAGVGRAMLLPEKSSCIGTMQYLIPRENINVRFLFYAIESMNLAKYNTGATIPHIYFKDYKKEVLPLIDIQEQQKIAHLLDKIRSLISYRQSQLQHFDDLVKSQFIEMFGDVVKNDKSWNCLPMTTVAPVSAYKGNIESTEGKYWLLNLDMVEAQTGDIISQVMVELNEVGASTVAFNQENVLYSKLRPYLNKVVNPKIAGYATSELVPLKPNKKYLNKVFFTALLRSDAFVHYIQEQVAGAKMPRVSMGVFRQFDVICPPIDLQNQFAAFVEQTDKSKFRIKQSLEKLEKCYKALLQKYFG